MEGIDLELFTTRPDEGVVEVVRKDQICPILLKNEEAMGLIMSGWVNEPKYRLKGRIYVHLTSLSACLIVCTPTMMKSMSLSKA